MEPNENIPKQPVRPVNPAGVGVPPRPVASRPVAPRPTVRPVAPRPVSSAPVSEPKEANEPTFDNGPSVVGKKERKTGWVLALILLFIIAAGGVGFGVWTYLDSNTQKDQLNSQISALQQQNADLQDELASSNNTTINIDTDGETTSAEDYIYVGEWGIKIKKPEGWRDLISEYSFSNDYPQAVDTLTIKEISDSDVANILISNNGESSCDNLAVAPDVCFEIGGNNFVVSVGDDVSDTLKAYFIEQDNYSEI